MDFKHRLTASGIRNTLASAHEGIHHLQGDRQPANRSDPHGQAKIESTVSYVGVDVENALESAERTMI